MIDIELLHRKRDMLKIKIRNYIGKNKDAYKLVQEYTDLTTQLQSLGKNVKIVAECLTLQNWEPGGKYYHLRSQQVKKTTSKKESSVVNDKEVYTLCLAWTSKDDGEPEQVKKVKDYFNELGLPMIDKNENILNNTRETILKYEFSGSEDSFRLLKSCTQFVLDTFAQSDFDKFNIAVWGKKMKK